MSGKKEAKNTNPRILAVIVASAIIMQQIDATAITTALPQMAISLCRLVSSVDNMRRVGKEIIAPMRQMQPVLTPA